MSAMDTLTYLQMTIGVKNVNMQMNFSNPTFGTTAAQAIAANPNRYALNIFNASAVTIYIAFTQQTTPSSTNGITLAPGAGLTLTAKDDGLLVRESVQAVAASGSGNNLHIFETVFTG